MLKKIMFLAIALSVLLTGCGSKPEVEHTRYTVQGRYYTLGICEDINGNVWEYSTDVISKINVYNEMPVYICLDDAGTPDNIYDDVVLGLVYDRETSVYDQLEDALADSFAIERDGNNIRILKEE
jgi:hypothetical protein